MDFTIRLRTVACTLGLLLYGPLLVGLSIWGLTWSGGQDKSALVLLVMSISVVFFVVGCIVVILTVWLWYEILAEEKRAKQAKNCQPAETLAMTTEVGT
jgi:hypothetical protein